MSQFLKQVSPPNELLFGGEILRKQYEILKDSLLKKRLDHLIWIARNWERHSGRLLETVRLVASEIVSHPPLRPAEGTYPFLAWLLTGEPKFAAKARTTLFELAATVEKRERTDVTQGHCWCDSFSFCRWLMLADWVWFSPVMTDEDRIHLEERFLYYLWAHPFQRLKTRAIESSPHNNQNGAMALACVTGGYLFGKKYGSDRRARRMLDLGLRHLRVFMLGFPKGGYSYEGSSYMAEVIGPVMVPALELVREATGEDLFECAVDADHATPREVLESMFKLSSPGGLLHPWDNYGYKRADFTPQAAYLAARTRDRKSLEFLESLGAFEEPSCAGWGLDKTLWTLVWMLRCETPEPITQPHPVERSLYRLCEPALGAGVAGPRERMFLLQMWDRNSAFPPTRAQFNPNSLVMEYDGSPLLLDGDCVEACKAADFRDPKYTYFKPDSNKTLSFGAGTVGAHNTIFFDGEDHYFPHVPTEGELIFHREQDGIALFESDVTAGYAGRYDVSSVRRACLVIGDEAVLVRDTISAASPHEITWRVHTRDGHAEVRPGGFSVETPDHVRLEICFPDDSPVEHRHLCAERRTQLEGRCHEVSRRERGAELCLHTLLVPTSLLEEWLPLSSGWEWRRAENADAVDAVRERWTEAQPIDFSGQSWFYTTGCHEPGTGVYRCEAEADGPVPETVFLRLPRLLIRPRLWINGREIPLHLREEGGPVTTHMPLVPHLVEVSGAFRQGCNRIEFASDSTLETALLGRITLLRPVSKVPRASLGGFTGANGAARLELRHHGVTDTVEWTREACVVTRPDGRTVRFSLAPDRQPPPRRVGKSPSREKAFTPMPPPIPADELAQAIRDPEWRVALAALEDAIGRTEKAVVQAAWDILQREVREHPTSPRRDPEDTCWYRLKAAAAAVLGEARFLPATGLLGEQLMDVSIFYPIRVACATALGRIGTPEAIDYLRRMPEYDELNTRVTINRELRKAGVLADTPGGGDESARQVLTTAAAPAAS